MTPEEIEDVIAHELGHNFGLPHNIEHDNIMATGIQDDSVRTYYETRGINVPGTEHSHEEEETNTPTTTINYEDNTQAWTADNILEHKAVIETIKVIEAILLEIPLEDRIPTWVAISSDIFSELLQLGIFRE